MDYLVVLFWSLVGSILSLSGGLLLIKASSKRDLFVRYAMPFGAGAMLVAALLGMLPEAAHSLGLEATMPWVLGGFVSFFILERGLSWFHQHHEHSNRVIDGVEVEIDGIDAKTSDEARNNAHKTLIVVGDTLHNAIDGVALGAAFVVSPGAGIGVALAILAHEVPQEMSDFGILLAKGMKARRVVLVNILSAMATVVTAMTTYALGSASGFDVGPLLAIAAGLFLYVAASDIIPDIHERPHKEAGSQIALLLAGIAVVSTVILSMPHDHSHDAHDEHDHHVHDEHEHHDHD